MTKKRKDPGHLVERGEGRHSVWADVVSAGDDLVVYIGGGERPHVGSLSLSGAGGEPISISVPGHKDYFVSSRAAGRISRATGRTCLVVTGIHIDSASREDIKLLLKNSDKCVEGLIRIIGKVSRS